ncbi:hypothetical protein [Novosphingobium arvoryzae]|uniref:Uncharacterized protein n=1 Tax=Novosphingobium arvoryzae TaxID=1256514 RepID=A0A918VK79_9SPHN|nr:hypothetical protein [Novosphingobium arvoryzae]GHA04273.1 hypothetical protein GCM10011617_26610 [Novosphingobium arvoryzae]
MQPAVYLLAPLALLLPGVAAEPDVPVEPAAELAGISGPVSRPETAMPETLSEIAESFRPRSAQQVRIEQRVTIRISPRAAPLPMMPSALADLDGGRRGEPRFIERKMGKCLALNGIAGVQAGPRNKLMLMLRDGRVVSATLDKACQGRDYYSGFLVAKNADGMLCTGRDELLSRSGSNCKVSGFRQIVEVDD